MARQSYTVPGLAAMLLSGVLLGGCAASGDRSAAPPGGHWVESWGAAQLVPEGDNVLAPAAWRDASMRQVVRASLGGSRLRIRVSNLFGTAPLRVDGASIGLAGAGGRASSLRPLRFGGQARVTIPAGAEYLSDPVDLAHVAGAELAVSLHFPEAPARQTGHPGARVTSFLVQGQHVMDGAWSGAQTFTRWYQLAGLEVLAPSASHTVVAIGDSITDGYGVTPGSYGRWTDHLATRLRAAGMDGVGVVNAGIGGGRLLQDGLGPNLAARFERDVLARPGVSHAIVMIGVNDLGVQHRNGEDSPAARAQLLDEMRAALRQLVARAHTAGVCVIGATISPYGGSGYYQPGPDNEADRQAINGWIRDAGVFDGTVDFDAVLRDPARPERLLPAYDNDGLHPSAPGYKAMADAVPLEGLTQCHRRQ